MAVVNGRFEGLMYSRSIRARSLNCVYCSTLSLLKRMGFIPEPCVDKRVTLPGVPACPVSSAAVPAALCGDRGSHSLGIFRRSVAATFLYVPRRNRKVYWYVMPHCWMMRLNQCSAGGES